MAKRKDVMKYCQSNHSQVALGWFVGEKGMKGRQKLNNKEVVQPSKPEGQEMVNFSTCYNVYGFVSDLITKAEE